MTLRAGRIARVVELSSPSRAPSVESFALSLCACCPFVFTLVMAVSPVLRPVSSTRTLASFFPVPTAPDFDGLPVLSVLCACLDCSLLQLDAGLRCPIRSTGVVHLCHSTYGRQRPVLGRTTADCHRFASLARGRCALCRVSSRRLVSVSRAHGTCQHYSGPPTL